MSSSKLSRVQHLTLIAINFNEFDLTEVSTNCALLHQTQFRPNIWTVPVSINHQSAIELCLHTSALLMLSTQCSPAYRTELTEWEWHATCSRQFDSRYYERIRRYTVISSHLTIYYVFAVIKTEVSNWIPFHVKHEAYIPSRFVALLRCNESTKRTMSCALSSRIGRVIFATWEVGKFRQPPVNRTVWTCYWCECAISLY